MIDAGGAMEDTKRAWGKGVDSGWDDVLGGAVHARPNWAAALLQRSWPRQIAAASPSMVACHMLIGAVLYKGTRSNDATD